MTRTSMKSKPKPKVPPPPKVPKVPPPPLLTTPSIKTETTPSTGFLDSVVSGFGWGIGTSLARKIFEPKVTHESPLPIPDPIVKSIPLEPDDVFKKYEECLERNEPNVKCEI